LTFFINARRRRGKKENWLSQTEKKKKKRLWGGGGRGDGYVTDDNGRHKEKKFCLERIKRSTNGRKSKK